MLTIPLGGRTSVSPTVADGVIYVPRDNNDLFAFDATRGAVLWSVPLAAVGFSSTPAVVDGVVYVSTVETVTSEL